MSALSQEELPFRIASADRAALDDLVRQNVDFVYASARRQVGDAHLAEDVTQAVFLVLLRKKAPVKPQHLSGWLFKTTRYAAANARRMQTRRTHYESQAPMRTSESSSDREPDVMMKMLDDALASLRQRDRAIVILRFLQSMELADVSRALGLNEVATRKRISRAMGKLREFFAARGVTVMSEAVIASGLQRSALIKAPVGLGDVIPKGSSGGNVALISRSVRMMHWYFAAKTGVVAILAGAVLAGGMKWMGGDLKTAPRVQTAAGPAPVVVAANAPATQPEPSQQNDMNECAGRIRDVGMAIFTYSNRHQGHLPKSLGETFAYVQPNHEWTPTHEPKATPAKKGSLYLTPEDAKAKNIPESPTPQWVDENTSFVYLGEASVVMKNLRSADSETTVIAHVKLDHGYTIQLHGKPTIIVPLLFLDGHEEAMTLDVATKLIEESKNRFDDVKQ